MRLAGLAGPLALLAVSPPLPASPFQQGLSVTSGLEYDSNPTLAASNDQAVWRVRLAPAYRLKWVKGADEWQASARLDAERSSDQSVSVDRDDPSLSLGWTRENPLGALSLRAGYVEASTRVTELSDTGELAPDATRTEMTLDADWDRSLSERLSLGLNAGYKDVSYQGGGSFTDYDNIDIGLTLSYLLDETRTPYLSLTASRYEPDGDAAGQPSSRQYGPLAGIKWQATELLNVDLNTGLSRINGETSQTQWRSLASVSYQGERLASDLGYQRAAGASGAGGYAESDRITLDLRYAYSDLSDVGVTGSWRKNRSDLANTTTSLVVWASRELTETWSLRGSFQIKEEKDTGPTAQAAVWMLSVSYNRLEL